MMNDSLEPFFHIYTNVSESIGFGGVFGKHWFYGEWQDEWWKSQNLMMLELYPI